MMTIAILNLLTVPTMKYYERTGNMAGMHMVWGYETFFNVLFLIELLVNFMVIGLTDIFSKGHITLQMECFFQLIFFVSVPTWMIMQSSREGFTYGGHLLLDIMQMVILLRLSRIFRFMQELEQYDYLTRAITVMRGPFTTLLLTLYSLFFLYTVIGMELFGGRVDGKTMKAFSEESDYFQSASYMWMNFNDFGSGMLTMFCVMLSSGWHTILMHFEFAVDNFATAVLFFISFIIVSSYIITNILFAFVIDVYSAIEEQIGKQREERAAIIKLGMDDITFQDNMFRK